MESRDIWKQMAFVNGKSRTIRQSWSSKSSGLVRNACCACSQGPPGLRGNPGKDGLPGAFYLFI